MPRRDQGNEGTALAVDTRRAKRVRLYSPIHAEVQGIRVALVDLSAVGARVEAQHPLAVGSETTLSLSLDEATIAVPCLVIRCSLDRSMQRDAIIYNAGLEFDETAASMPELREMIRRVVESDFEARRSYT